MIQVVMFDLGDTLIDASHHPFPHVTDALAAVASQGLQSCLVSDFDMSLTPAKAMEAYVAVLESAGLRSLFEPVNKRVTLSNHAGVLKPGKKIFTKALARLGAAATPLTDCLFVTENADHIDKARNKLHMQTLQFGVDFTDWSQFPALIPSGPAMVPITVPGHEHLGTLLVEVPTATREHVEEARSYVAGLAARGQIEGAPGVRGARPTHAIETDEAGNRRLVRKGFSLLERD
ncbi:MAG: hypothetical protein U0Q16_23910 [Bryobacteraceae bacterium]